MAESVTNLADKLALSPGALVYVGDRPEQGMASVLWQYDRHNLSKTADPSPEDLQGLTGGEVAWLQITGLGDSDYLAKAGAVLGLHALTLEDILNTRHAPKLEEFSEYLLLALKLPIYDPEENYLITKQLSLVLGRGWLLSFEEGGSNDLSPLLARLEQADSRLRKRQVGYLAYAIWDLIQDHYFAALEKMSRRLDDMEDMVLESPSPEVLEGIYRLRRASVSLRKVLWPLREMASSFQRIASDWPGQNLSPYLRDLKEHIVQAMDMNDILRENLASLMDLYLNQKSHRMNEIMKILTIMASIFIPLTFLAGIYGMNFKYMPELDWIYAYPLLLGIMVVVVVVMLFFFRAKGWLGNKN
ncbi:magnesium/cobalt transporter CorA [Dethiosulfatarculus sandiegensis]|uniref:magnesium/cobalt transporter CorA n=1 Tax=Dethiosulfatarculus sandiegensis TaxID=1429043 RepID=UPI0005CA0481|nr:magnesium/cobalt transporter CorA [Dethiosulfatarculus sandiegensis]